MQPAFQSDSSGGLLLDLRTRIQAEWAGVPSARARGRDRAIGATGAIGAQGAQEQLSIA
jgi:hypothetical protein